jgi:predicted RNA-binding Zn-ribbon protein involved in translation (DUF1610 family)
MKKVPVEKMRVKKSPAHKMRVKKTPAHKIPMTPIFIKKDPEESKVACKFCGNLYKPCSLNGHQTSCKENPNRKQFECPECGKMLSRRDKLVHHMKSFHLGASLPVG